MGCKIEKYIFEKYMFVAY